MNQSRTRYKEVFPDTHTLLAVVEPTTAQQALKNCELATTNGCQGVFLTNNRIDADALSAIYVEVRKALPTAWIGLNFRELTPLAAVNAAAHLGADGCWTENAGIDERREFQPLPMRVQELLTRLRSNLLYFGGVSFYNQREVEPSYLPVASMIARRYVDVVTTSGSFTGDAPRVEKIQALREGLRPDAILAIAGGIDIQNVKKFMPYANCFLVSSGMSANADMLDAKRITQLAKAIRG